MERKEKVGEKGTEREVTLVNVGRICHKSGPLMTQCVIQGGKDSKKGG